MSISNSEWQLIIFLYQVLAKDSSKVEEDFGLQYHPGEDPDGQALMMTSILLLFNDSERRVIFSNPEISVGPIRFWIPIVHKVLSTSWWSSSIRDNLQSAPCMSNVFRVACMFCQRKKVI